MDTTKDTYLTDLFINEAKPALNRHSGGGGEGGSVNIEPLTVTENGTYSGGSTKAFSPVVVSLDGFARDLLRARGLNGGNFFYGVTMFTKAEEYLRYVSYEDTSNLTQMQYFFQGNASAVTLPLLDTSKATHIASMFNGCSALTRLEEYDFQRVISFANSFNGCVSLTECRIKNIKAAIQIGSGTTYGHLLTVESLIHLIYELRDTGSMLTCIVGTANLEKLANVYVRTIDITDEMRAEDDLIDEKLPFEVCESTDAGAILITDYAPYKHWQIA